MTEKEKYKALIKDTISYLKNLDKQYIVSKNLNLCSNPQKKASIDNLINHKKYNIQIQEIKPAEPQKSIPIQQNTNLQPKPIEPTAKEIDKEPDSPKINVYLHNQKNSKKVILDKKQAFFEETFNDIKNIISKIYPEFNLQEPLDDTIAKKNSQKYKLKNIAADIVILAYKENEKHYKFLEKLAIALDIYFYPTKVISAYLIEKENNWLTFLSENNIQLIISCDYTIFELKNLRTFFKEIPAKNEKYLNDIPLFLLPDLSLYLKEPSLKASLFEALKQKIKLLNE